MRILAIINEWPIEKMGGSELHMLEVAQYWNADHEVDVVVPHLAYSISRPYLKGQVIVTDSPFEREVTSLPGRLILMCSRISRILRSPPQKEYDVIVAASHYVADVVPAIWLHRRNGSSKFIVYHHSGVSAGNRTLVLLRKINDAISVPLIRKYASLVFAITQPIKDSLISSGINDEKILVTENAISKVESSVPPQSVLFDACFVGRLEKGKGIVDLVTIWRTISDEIPAAKLAMIGIGSDKDLLVSLIKRDHLMKNVVLYGFVDDQKKFEVMQRSKLFVLPSYVDAKPIAFLEAMSCGLPVVAYDLPALKSTWGQDIAYVPQGDTQLFAKTVLELLEDPQKRLTLSRRGLNRSKDARTWKDIATYEINAIIRA